MSSSAKNQIVLKDAAQLEIMKQGGVIMKKVKEMALAQIRIGGNAWDVETAVTDRISQLGAKPSFKTVDGYYYSTCVNLNAGLVHGIPSLDIVFRSGDIISVDIGVLYRGFHTDSSFSTALNPDQKTKTFLFVGRKALKRAVDKAVAGNRIFDLSSEIERTILEGGYQPVRALVGHGVGASLHEEPPIPCFTIGNRKDSPEIRSGMALAIEVMYTQGRPEVSVSDDGWTISTCDGKISALFEETVIVTKNGPLVITA